LSRSANHRSPFSCIYSRGKLQCAHETVTQISSCLPSPLHPPSKNEEGSRYLLSFCNRDSCELLWFHGISFGRPRILRSRSPEFR
jgi:hypothetical protein